jgi:AcrR family transcriptional regulator
MNNATSEIAALRREQIIEAALAVINEQGLQNLSLSEIEKKADMSRGQLTYYFPTKESILLAVFDRHLQLMYQRLGSPQVLNHDGPCEPGGWDWIQHLLKAVLTDPPANKEIGCLQYTFLAQINHREDFRAKLVWLFGEWRNYMTQGLAADLEKSPPIRPVSPRAVATLVQAILHGLRVQAAVEPQAFSGPEILDLCLDMLGSYLWGPVQTPQKPPSRSPKKKTKVSPVPPAPKPGRRSTLRG